MTVEALIEKLKIAPQHVETILSILNELAKEQTIVVENGLISKEKPQAAAATTTIGTISIHPKGFGFVVSKDLAAYPQDIFIPKPFIADALDGDEVLTQITAVTSPKGPEGAILKVLKRRHHEVTGTIISRIDQKSYALFAPLYGAHKQVVARTDKVMKLSPGTRLTITVTEWGSEKDPVYGDLKTILGQMDDPSIDVQAGVLEYHIAHRFPETCVSEAKTYGKKITPSQCKNREDLTQLETFTIDPTTAKDYDDALSVIKEGSRYRLYVHIADVSYYVKPQSALDDEAYKRGNSTYFPGRCIPMLPEELSNELCSLKENVKRLAVTVEMLINPDGSVDSYQIYRSVIKSQKRFTYLEAKEVLDGKRKSKHAPTLQLMVELCAVLKRLRAQRGSIDLAMPAIDLLIDAEGIPQGLERVEYDITHQMVEEFMLKANEMVAFDLVKKGKPAVFRVHDVPEKENLEDFYNMVRALGFHLKHEPTHEDLQRVFHQAQSTPFASQLAMNFIRSMKLAFYSDQNVGHYGLALEHYCHFTSPIRRYTDVIVHRQLFEPSETVDLKALSKHCSDTERKSFKAETSVVILKKLRYLAALMKEDPKKTYAATITKIKPFGFFFELDFLMFEGYAHVSELEDYYTYVQHQDSLVGKRGGQILRHGTKLAVSIQSIDLIERAAQFRCSFKPHQLTEIT